MYTYKRCCASFHKEVGKVITVANIIKEAAS